MTTFPQDDHNEPFLTVREMVVEIRRDVKDLGRRVGALETTGFQLRGVWTGIGVATSCAVGVAGLILGALTYF